MSQPLVEIYQHPANIVEVRLQRPDKKNALSIDMLGQLLAVGKSLRKRRDISAILISGEGASFCAGIDLSDLRNPKNRIKAAIELLWPGTNFFQKVFLIWREMPVPVIAVIHGHCYGAGLQLVLGADFRIVTPDAKLSIMEARWGLIPDMSATVTLRGQLNLDVIKELAMTAKTISGEEAKLVGLATHISTNPFQKGLELAKEISNNSPDAVAGVKRIFNASTSKSNHKTLAMERWWQLRLLLGKNFKIATMRSKDSSVPYRSRSIDD